MTANTFGATPFTPYPDPPSHSGEEADPPPLPGRAGPERGPRSDMPLPLQLGRPHVNCSAQSSPDPFLEVTSEAGRGDDIPAHARSKPSRPPEASPPGSLGGSPRRHPPNPRSTPAKPIAPPARRSSSGTDLESRHPPLALSRCAGPGRVDPSPRATSGELGGCRPRDEEAPRINWPLLLTASYASAVTLALSWLLWTGYGTGSQGRSALAPGFPAGAGAPPRAARPAFIEPLPPLPSPNMTSLGEPIRLGDLEVIPRSIIRRRVELTRLEGSTGEQRESPDSLVLTLQLTNRSAGFTLNPLDPAFVRESSAAADHSYIEIPVRVADLHVSAGTGERVVASRIRSSRA